MRYGSVQNAEIHLFCSENRNFLKKRQSIDPGKPMLLCGSRNVSSLPTYHTHCVFSFTTHRSPFTVLIPTKTGNTKMRAMMEKSSPPFLYKWRCFLDTALHCLVCWAIFYILKWLLPFAQGGYLSRLDRWDECDKLITNSAFTLNKWTPKYSLCYKSNSYISFM